MDLNIQMWNIWFWLIIWTPVTHHLHWFITTIVCFIPERCNSHEALRVPRKPIKSKFLQFDFYDNYTFTLVPLSDYHLLFSSTIRSSGAASKGIHWLVVLRADDMVRHCSNVAQVTVLSDSLEFFPLKMSNIKLKYTTQSTELPTINLFIFLYPFFTRHLKMFLTIPEPDVYTVTQLSPKTHKMYGHFRTKQVCPFVVIPPTQMEQSNTVWVHQSRVCPGELMQFACR